MRAVVVALVLCATASLARAGEYRGGSMNWQVRDLAAPRTVEVTVTTYWDEPAVGDTGVSVDFGDGQASGVLVSTVILTGRTRARGEAFTIREARTTHTYAADGAYTASISGCCRHATVNARATDGFRLQADVVLGSGSYGNPAMMMVDAQLVAGPAEFRSGLGIPDETWWGGHVGGGRLATADESGVTPPAGPTYQTSVYGGTLTWDALAQRSPGESHTVALVREDLGGSSAMLDFIVETVPYELLDPYCFAAMHDAPLGAQPGETVTRTFTVYPEAGDARVLVPSSATLAPGPWTLSWTPGPADAGRYGVAYVTVGSGSYAASCWLGLHVPLSTTACEAGLAACGEHMDCRDTSYGFTCACEPGYMASSQTLDCEAGCYVVPMTCGFDHGFPVGLQCCTDPDAPTGVTCTCPITPDPPDPPTDTDDGGCSTSQGSPGLAYVLALAAWLSRRRGGPRWRRWRRRGASHRPPSRSRRGRRRPARAGSGAGA